MAHPVTDYINSTESLVDFAVERLSGDERWSVCKLPGMFPEKIAEYLPGLRLPAMAVTHRSSVFGNQPRRLANLTVLVCVDAKNREAEFSARRLSDAAIALLDEQVNGHACYRIKRYDALKPDDSALILHHLDFEVSDH